MSCYWCAQAGLSGCVACGQLATQRRAADLALEAMSGRPANAVDGLEAAVYRAAQRRPLLTADDVWAYVVDRPAEPRALGVAMRRAVANGWLEFTDTYRPSSRRHASPQRVYRSLVSR